MSSAQQLFDAAGRRRSPATMPEFHAGRAPGNKGQRYAADPPTVDEIIAVMRHARHARYGNRLTGLIVVLWRAGLRINEALSLAETDLAGHLVLCGLRRERVAAYVRLSHHAQVGARLHRRRPPRPVPMRSPVGEPGGASA